jgi:4-hydroxythreonine-4-phosphate dehydrogenase
VLFDAGSAATVDLDPSADRREGPHSTSRHGGGIAVIDLAVRDRPNDEARAAIERTMADYDVRYVKIDSLLRGPIRGIVEGAASAHRQRLLCPALPSADRIIVDGVPLVDGRPLWDSTSWQLESGRPPRTVAGLLGAIPSRQVGRSAVAIDLDSDQAGTVLCADARNDDDLDWLAALTDRHDLFPIGSAGLLSALVRREHGHLAVRSSDAPQDEPCADGAVVIAIGTASPAARDQADALVCTGVDLVELDAARTDTDVIGELTRLLDDQRTVIVRWSTTTHIDPTRSAPMAERFATVVADVANVRPTLPLILTGGHTAHTVLRRLGVTQLTIASVVQHGAVVATTNSGRVVVIRPGSFGHPGSLETLRNRAISIARKVIPPSNP